MKITFSNNKPRSRMGIGSFLFLILCFIFFCLFTSLGIWQIERRAWKMDLITRVNMRVHHKPIEAPYQDQWGNINQLNFEYLPVKVIGRYLNDKQILITTVTDSGSGYWLMVPFIRKNGEIIFINRGFIPLEKLERTTRQIGEVQGETVVKGLLRLNEKQGSFFRKNNPRENRWYIRNIDEMSVRLKLNRNKVAPYFIDADSTKNTGGYPIGGLTVINFYNHHLSYIITWFILALGMVIAACFVVYSNFDVNKKR